MFTAFRIWMRGYCFDVYTFPKQVVLPCANKEGWEIWFNSCIIRQFRFLHQIYIISTFASLENEINGFHTCNLCCCAATDSNIFVGRRKWDSVDEFSQMKQNTLLETFPIFFGSFFENSTNTPIRPLLFATLRWSSVFYSCCYWHLRINIATPNGRSRPFPLLFVRLIMPSPKCNT